MDLKGILESLLRELYLPCNYMFEGNSSKFYSIYLLATALDPTLRMFSFPEQVSNIKTHINSFMKDMVKKNGR